MELMIFLLSVFGAIGTTVIITDSKLFILPRKFIVNSSTFFGGMITCAMCLGYWIGLVTFNATILLFEVDITILLQIFISLIYAPTVSMLSLLYVRYVFGGKL